MKLYDLWFLSPQAFVFIVKRDKELKLTQPPVEYCGGKILGKREVARITPASYPMHKNVLEVELKEEK